MHWTLRKKVLLGYGVVLLLGTLVFAWAFLNLLRLGRASDAILSENYRSIIAAENMIDALERQDSGVLLYILGFEDEGTEQFQENEHRFLQWFSRAKDNTTIEGEAEIINRIDSAYSAYPRVFTSFLQERAASGQRPALEYHEMLLPAFMAVRDASAELRDLNERTMEIASDRAGAVADRAMWSMGIVGLLTLGLGLILSFVLSNRLVRPIQRMRDATKHITEGDYDVEVIVESKDELGLLATQFNEMTAQLRAYRDLNIERIMAEQKKSEAVIQSIDDGLVVVGADLYIEGMNPAAAYALGVNRTEALGQPFLEVVQSEKLFQYVRETVASGATPAIKEEQTYFSVERGEAQQHYQFVVTPVYTPSKVMLGAILLLRDVTKLKELDRLKSEFVATASHELKTPLTSIGMSIGLLEERAETKLDDRERELLAAAGEDVERLKHLVNDLLDLSKIEAGKIELNFEAVPVSLLVGQAVQSLKAQAEEKDIELINRVPDHLPDVRADANKVTWVLTNLISNALRYTSAGGHIELKAEPAGSKMHLSVQDDGEGIPYVYQSKIFDKFVQVAGKKSIGGSGLGLAICKEIVRAHGGSIWVDSIPGIGATFTFTLPLASAQKQ
jgi:NtrC-family two-component system sensor histidine kinase KinB